MKWQGWRLDWIQLPGASQGQGPRKNRAQARLQRNPRLRTRTPLVPFSTLQFGSLLLERRLSDFSQQEELHTEILTAFDPKTEEIIITIITKRGR